MLSKYSVKKPYTVVVAVVLVIILGVVSFTNMTVDLLPSMNLPYAIVMTSYPGASPEEVEMVVTKPVEQSMATISNIETVSSSSSENVSTVILEFGETTNMDSATIEMREKLDQIKGFWPDEVSNPMIMKLNPNMMPIMVSAVSVKGDDAAQTTELLKKNVIPEIESIEGVASVSAVGSVEETVKVTVNPDKIEKINADVKKELEKQFEDASAALADAKAKVQSGKQALLDGQKKAADELGKAETEISKKSAEITQGLLEVSEKKSALELASAQLAQTELTLSMELLNVQGQMELVGKKAELEAALELLESTGGSAEQIAAIKSQLAQIAELEPQMPILKETEKQLSGKLTDIAGQKEQIKAGQKQLDELEKQLNAGAISLAEARGQLTSGQIQAITGMASGSAQLSVGEATLNSKSAEFEEQKKKAEEQADMSGVLNADMVKTLLSAQNFNMPAGYVQEKGIDYLIRVGNKFDDVDDLRNLVLVDTEGIEPVHLSDVADVEIVNNADDIYAKVNGEAGVMLSIQKQTGYSTGEVSNRILEKFDKLQKENKEIHVSTLMDQGVYIDLVVNSVLDNMVYGAILAIIILLIFLRNVRPTFIIACSIPISIMAAIVLMYFSGVTLNVISLSGLALGVGMLVDNSIVVIENIYRMRNEEGATPKQAAIEGAKEVAGAIMASTLTTICVFAPIVFTQGITRQLFVDMGLTIAYSLVASLVVALTLVPMMGAGLLKNTKTQETKFFGVIKDNYEKLLRTALSHKVLVLVLAFVLLIGSGILAYTNGTAFMPEMESTQITMSLETEKGTSLQDTAKEADKFMDRLMKIEDVEDVGAMTGGGGLMGGGGNSATNRIQIYALVKEDRTLSNQALQKRIEKETKDINAEITVNMSSMDMSALGTAGISVQIQGKDLDVLEKTAKEVAAIVAKDKGVQNVSDGMDETTEELRVVVDKTKASKYNLTVAQVYQEVSKLIGAPKSATSLSTDTKDYDVFVENAGTISYTRDDIKNMKLTVTGQDGKKKEIPLEEIVSFEDAVGLQSIRRTGQSRYMSVTAEIKEGDNIGLVSNRIKEKLKDYKAPEGYEIKMTGEDETIMESMVELFKMLGLAIVFMYLIMVAQFQSLRSPFIIMFTIPLAFTGGLLALFISGSPISVIAMIGFVMLSGIIVNNGIVFIDYTNQLIREGMQTKEALVEAGRTRLRPIIMTALTTILGLLTMAFGVGMGADMVQPMAIVTIGGLIYGTVLTLFVVPCIYALFHKKEKARLMERMNGEDAVDEE